MRRPLKMQSFAKLKEMNLPVKTVIDVGILTGTSELIRAFGEAKQILIEPVIEWNDIIHKRYAESGIDYELVNVAAAERDGVMHMKVTSVRDGQAITHARLTTQTEGDNVRTVDVRTLNGLVAERDLPRPFLLKLDVDGVEIRILDGAHDILPDCSVIVIEANIRNFIERANYLLEHGFELFDIVDPCYYDNRLRQFDLIFLNTQMVQDCGLDMYKQPFDISKWIPYK